MSAATLYLKSFEHYFWQYEDRGKVIAVPNGHTLGYTEHILNEFIVHLAPQGLPRFGSLLIALAATNSQANNTLDDIMSIVNRHTVGDGNDDIYNGLQFAKLITQLPVRYKKGQERLELLRAIFTESHNSINKNVSLRILNEIKKDAKLSSFPNIVNKVKLTRNELIRKMTDDFKSLRVIGKKLNNVEAIMARITGLPEITEQLTILEEDLEKQGEEEGLIEQLINLDSTFHVGSLVSRLISGLHIPFHSSLPSEQPLGGVADITNKGNFDKLLMSEFAFDDFTLLSRLANNESLYHHREAPPADNNYSRVILIDTTLKNWGTIRTISFAAMLAITNHPKNKNPCRVFLIGQSFKEIKFETADDILDGLQYLDNSLDPGVGLEELFTTIDIKISEIFFIGYTDSLECVGMQRFISALGKRIDHWIHPDEHGKILVYKNPKRGKRFIQELNIPLDELWKRTRKKLKEVKPNIDYNYPILFPIGVFKTKWHGEYVYIVTKDKALLRSYQNINDRVNGFELVSSNFLPSDILKAVITHNDLSISVLVTNQQKELSIIQFPPKERIYVDNFRHSKSISLSLFTVETELFTTSTPTRTIQIDTNGAVTEKPTVFKVTETNTDPIYYSSLYRNIKQVYITTDNELRFGKQDLKLIDNKIKLLHQGNFSKSKIASYQTSLGVFRFPDDSTIIHDRNGMLTLISASKMIPKIYVPAVLNLSLGVATDGTFSGNPMYKKNPLVEILITDLNGYNLAVTKVIDDHLAIGLKEAKAMADKRLISTSDEKKILFIEENLDNMDVQYIKRKRGIAQTIIPPQEFYGMYIQEFIDHIITHSKI